MKKKDIDELISFERSVYYESYSLSFRSYQTNSLLGEPITKIIKWQRASRYCDYYNQQRSFFSRIFRVYYRYLRNKFACRIGIDASTENVGKGLLIYHPYGTVINGRSILGENVHLHGNNCIGNAGEGHSECPVIGNNVTIGVGAKVIGGIKIADNIKIAAGAVVVHSFEEPGVTIGGVPAKILNKSL